MTKNITAVGQEKKDFAVKKYTVGLDLGIAGVGIACWTSAETWCSNTN